MTREEFNNLPDWKTGPQTKGIVYKYDDVCSCTRKRKDGVYTRGGFRADHGGDDEI